MFVVFVSFFIILIPILSFQVRLGEVLEDGRVNTKSLGRDCGCVYRLAVEHENPHILYSCGEDGFLRHVCECL